MGWGAVWIILNFHSVKSHDLTYWLERNQLVDFLGSYKDILIERIVCSTIFTCEFQSLSFYIPVSRRRSSDTAAIRLDTEQFLSRILEVYYEWSLFNENMDPLPKGLTLSGMRTLTSGDRGRDVPEALPSQTFHSFFLDFTAS